jgi:hypothetical protein
LAMDYLDKFSVFTPKLFDDSVARKSFDDTEADLMKPRLESFWQNNGLLVRMCMLYTYTFIHIQA